MGKRLSRIVVPTARAARRAAAGGQLAVAARLAIRNRAAGGHDAPLKCAQVVELERDVAEIDALARGIVLQPRDELLPAGVRRFRAFRPRSTRLRAWPRGWDG